MVIYGEYLFLENFITGAIILILTGKIAGIQPKKSLLLLGSSLCGAYSFILFWTALPPWLALLIKFAFSIIVTFLVFQVKRIRQFSKIVLVFYLVSFLMGGITIGAMYFFGYSGITQNASVYMDHVTYLNVVLGCLITYIGLSIFSDFIKGRLNREKTTVDVEIELEDKTATLKGMVDTGNFLQDPLTGSPVLIITADGAKKLLPEELVEEAVGVGKMLAIYENLMKTSYANRIRMIPYQSIGEERGYLIGVRPDKIHITTKDRNLEHGTISVPDGVVLAIYKGLFAGKNPGEDCSVLLHPSIIEGGVACNG